MEALSVELRVGLGAGEDTMGHEPAAAGDGDGGGGGGAAVGVTSNTQPSVTAAAMGVDVSDLLALRNKVLAIQQSLALPQLRRLTAGLMCKMPLRCFAPNLTRINDVSTYADSATLHAF
jgi:hypothetical protein